jgi:transposase-like protein
MPSGRTRDLQKESFWRRAVREHAGSGMSVRAWCLRHGLEARDFYRWRTKLARRDEEKAATVPTDHLPFVPVRVIDDRAAYEARRLEIVLAGGQCIRISGRVDRQMLGDVLAVLAAAGSADSEGQSC